MPRSLLPQEIWIAKDCDYDWTRWMVSQPKWEETGLALQTACRFRTSLTLSGDSFVASPSKSLVVVLPSAPIQTMIEIAKISHEFLGRPTQEEFDRDDVARREIVRVVHKQLPFFSPKEVHANFFFARKPMALEFWGGKRGSRRFKLLVLERV